MLNHTGGTYSHNGMMEYPRPNFGMMDYPRPNFSTLWNFKAGRSTS